MKKIYFLLSVFVVAGFISCTSKKSDEPFTYHYLDGTTVISEFHEKNEKTGAIDMDSWDTVRFHLLKSLV